ncbi:Rieske [2Fe-2S] domain protein [Clavulina sp. PMI_390]|nr:Rieske [2Fe-2S] domain protein [Clavulina sp. PMI_390]
MAAACEFPARSSAQSLEDGDKSLPAQWFRDERIYQLERRAIFSKLWILATHRSRFTKPGDYLKLEYAGYPYLVVKNKEGGFSAFHNVCRHRAFPLVHKETGSSLVLGCKYHGWSYSSSTGALIKAPQFTSSEGSPLLDKEANGLFKLHVHVTDSGFIFINFKHTVRFEEHFGALPAEWNGFNPDNYEYAYSWTKVGAYNWKTLMDGYQECYHCHIAHPGFAKSLALETYAVSPQTNFARHTADNKAGANAVLPEGADKDEAPPSFTFIFPTNGVTVTPMMWYMMRTVPVSATETRMEYDVFKRKGEPMEKFRKYMEFYEQVEIEDYDLCVATQRNLNSGIYSRGFLHPDKEIGVLFYQSRVRAFVEEHLALEKARGFEINLAQPASQVETGCSGGKGDAVCASMNTELAW